MRSSEGFSKIIHTPHYAIVTNICVNLKNNALTIHLRNEAELSGILTLYKRKDFFCPLLFSYSRASQLRPRAENPSQSEQARSETPASGHRPSALSFQPLPVHRGRGHAQLRRDARVRLPLRSPHFSSQPQIEHLLLLGEDSLRPIGFNSLLLRALLSLFPTSRPVDWIDKTSSLFAQNHVCDRVMVGILLLTHHQVLLRDWQELGGGAFFPSLPAVNALRCALYSYAHYTPASRVPPTLNTLLLNRRRVRHVENLTPLAASLSHTFASSLTVATLTLSDFSTDELAQVFARTDVLLSAYGSEILYALFMQPHSAVVELYPPFWDWSHYKRFSLNVGLLHRAYKAKGEQGPQCKKRAKSKDCLFQGTRDRNFTVDITEMESILKEVIVLVYKDKYGYSTLD